MAADVTSTLRIDLQDGVSSPAADAVKALQELKAKLNEDVKALREAEAAMRRLKAAGQGNSAEAQKLAGQIKDLKEGVGKSTSALVAQGASLDLGAQKTAALGVASSKSALASAGMVAPMLAVAAAAATVVTAMAGVIASLARYALAQSDARRSEQLRLEGMMTIRRWHGIAAGSATQLQEAIDRVSDSTASGSGEVSRYAERLYRAGLRGQALETALEGVATVASVQGDQMANRFAGMAASAALTGRSVRALTDDVRARLGGIAARQVVSLDRQMIRLRQNITRIFSGIKLDGALRGLRMVLDLFSQSTASGQALKNLVQRLFQPLANAVEVVAPIVREFFEGIIIGAQELQIGINRLRLRFLAAFGSDVFGGLTSGLDATQVGIRAFQAAVSALGLALVLVGVPLASMVATLAGLGFAAWSLGQALGSVATAFVREWSAAWDQITEWADIGANLMLGLENGVRRGARRVLDFITGMADRIANEFRMAMGIQSPSRVFARLGVQIPAGLERGIERGTPGVDSAVDNMVAVPTEGASGGPAPAGRASSPTVSLTVQTLNVNGSNAQEMAQNLMDELSKLLEGVSVEMGVAR